MPRPSRYERSVLVDHAVTLAAGGGPSAVTMTAVARAAGAPSGSVYHRFPNRPALLAAVWLRTVEQFQAGLLYALDDRDPVEACAAAARHVVAWSSAHPDGAEVLLHGESAFAADAWDADDRGRAAALRAALGDAVAAVAARLDLPTARADRVLLAVVDVPYALVRRHVRAGTAIPDDAIAAVDRCARALLHEPAV